MPDPDEPYRPPQAREPSAPGPDPFPAGKFLTAVLAAPACAALGAIGHGAPAPFIVIGFAICLPCAIYAGSLVSGYWRQRQRHGGWEGFGAAVAILFFNVFTLFLGCSASFSLH